MTARPIRLVRGDRIIRRTPCWRPACRGDFADVATILYMTTGRVVAFCHRSVHDDLGHRADVWKHGQVAA